MILRPPQGGIHFDSGTLPRVIIDDGECPETPSRSLGEDVENMEKHVLTKATAIYIPAGLYHCPLVFKEVTRPIALTGLTDEYHCVV